MLYTIYWDNGVKEVLEGTYPAEATSKSELRKDNGYFWEKGDKNPRVWCEDSKRWEWVERQPIKNDPRFKPNMFFQNIQKFMEEKGFESLGLTDVSTDTHEYHVHFCYPCRNTSMIFKLREKSLLLILTHAEQVYTDTKKYSESWSIRIDCQVLYTWDSFASEKEYGRHSPSFKEFEHRGWSSAGYLTETISLRTWNLESNANLRIKPLVDDIEFGLKELVPYLTEGPVDCLPTWSPSAYKNCDAYFWSKLDLTKLEPYIQDSHYFQERLLANITNNKTIKLNVPQDLGKNI